TVTPAGMTVRQTRHSDSVWVGSVWVGSLIVRRASQLWQCQANWLSCDLRMVTGLPSAWRKRSCGEGPPPNSPAASDAIAIANSTSGSSKLILPGVISVWHFGQFILEISQPV